MNTLYKAIIVLDALNLKPWGQGERERDFCALENLNGSHEEYRSQRGYISIVPFWKRAVAWGREYFVVRNNFS